MDTNKLSQFIIDRYKDIFTQKDCVETSFFYNPNFRFPRGTYFVTIKEKDGDNDKSSNLYRENIFRLSFSTDKKDFFQLFSEKPARYDKSEVIIGKYDFTKLDKLMPHPVYAWLGWVCILNPTE